MPLQSVTGQATTIKLARKFLRIAGTRCHSSCPTKRYSAKEYVDHFCNRKGFTNYHPEKVYVAVFIVLIIDVNTYGCVSCLFLQYSKTWLSGPSLSRQTRFSPHERLGRISRHLFYIDKLPPLPLTLATTYTSLAPCNLTSLCRHCRSVGGC